MMLPVLELLGLVNVWLMELPLLALAPVIEPILVPNVHANVLVVLAANVIFGLVPLQIVAVLELNTAGLGFIVTVIAVELPIHDPAVDVGVTL